MVAAAVLGIPVLGVLAVGLLALRLCFGPIEIGWLAHRLAPRMVAGEELRFGAVQLGWRGLAGDQARGRAVPLSIAADALSLRRADGTVDARAGRVGLALALPALLHGALAIEQVVVRDGSLALRRGADGGVGLEGGASQPVGHAARGGRDGQPRLDRLRMVAIDRLSVSLDDRLLHRRLDASIAQARLSPVGGLAIGRLRATLAIAGHAIPVEADGAPSPNGLRWHLSAGALVPDAFASLLPSLAGVALPVTPSVDLLFKHADPVPVSALLSVSLGAGTLAVGDGTLPVGSGAIVLQAERQGTDGVSARLRQMRLALQAQPGAAEPAPVFTGSGTMSLDHAVRPQRISAALVLDSASIGFGTLARYWPAGVAAGARRWVTGNIAAGEATGLHVETALSGDKGWSSMRETRRSGGFDAHDLVMWWLRPMPPLRRMEAHVVFQGSNALLVESPSAVLPVEAVGPAAERLGGKVAPQPLAVSDGSMRITGLDGAEQIGDIGLTLSGGLGDLLVELANPRLSLLSKHPVPFSAPSGQVRSVVTVRLPLDDKVSIENVAVSARSEIRGAHLGAVAAGMALDDADLTVSADTDGLMLDGTGAIGGIDSRLHYAMDFRAGAPDQLVEQAQVEGIVGRSSLAGLGIDPGNMVSGSGGLHVAYRARRDGHSAVDLALDMTGLGISLPVWSKRPGQKAAFDATVVLEHGQLASVGPIHVDGPALSVEGEVSAAAANGPRRLVVRRFLLGRSRGAGEVLFPREGGRGAAGRAPIRVSARGPSLDLAAIIDAGSSDARPGQASRPDGGRPARAAPARAAPTGPAWTADLDFARVFVGGSTALGGVSAHLENDGQAIVRARVDAITPTRLSLSLFPDGVERRVAATADDTGALLRGLGVTDAVDGGAMRLSAQLPPPGGSGSPVTGTVRIDRFMLPDAPVAARIVRDLSIYGWLLAPHAPELAVDRLVAPFLFRDGVLTLVDARAHAAAIGVTMRGDVDLDRRRLDLRGTVVPAWAVNQLPGRLPLVGRLLAPEKGGGVVAVTLGIKGPFAEPRISVDPLSALAPGFLRKLFFD